MSQGSGYGEPPPAPGWYVQPDGSQQYWDGHAWTGDYLAPPAGGTYEQGLNQSSVYPAPPTAELPSRRNLLIMGGIIVVALVAVVVGILVLGSGSNTNGNAGGSANSSAGGASSPSAVASSEEASSEPSPSKSDRPATKVPPIGTCKAAAGSGISLGSVSIRRNPDAVAVRWTTTQPMPTSGTVLYAVTIKVNENSLYQLGVKYDDGRQVAYFVYNFRKQENISGSATHDAKSVVGSFPDKYMPDVGNFFGWNSALNVGGDDVSRCPTSLSEYESYPPKQ